QPSLIRNQKQDDDDGYDENEIGMIDGAFDKRIRILQRKSHGHQSCLIANAVRQKPRDPPKTSVRAAVQKGDSFRLIPGQHVLDIVSRLIEHSRFFRSDHAKTAEIFFRPQNRERLYFFVILRHLLHRILKHSSIVHLFRHDDIYDLFGQHRFPLSYLIDILFHTGNKTVGIEEKGSRNEYQKDKGVDDSRIFAYEGNTGQE